MWMTTRSNLPAAPTVDTSPPSDRIEQCDPTPSETHHIGDAFEPAHGLSRHMLPIPQRSRRAVRNSDAPKHVAQMYLHGALGDAQLPTDLLVRHTSRGKPQHLGLPVAQLIRRLRPRGEQGASDARIDRHLTTSRRT